MYTEIKTIKSNIRTFFYGAAVAVAAFTGGFVEFLKTLM